MSAKEQVLQAIQQLPDDVGFAQLSDEVALLKALAEAERDIERGAMVSNEALKERINEWTGA